MKILKETTINNFLSNDLEDGIYYAISNEIMIFSGYKNYDLKYDLVSNIAKNNKILYYPLKTIAGGTILVPPNSLFIATINTDIKDKLLSIVHDFFTKKYNLSYMSLYNDFIVNNGKVGSIYYGQLNDKEIFGIWFNSTPIDKELKDQICFGPNLKTPKGLSEFNIKPIEILDYIQKSLT